MTSEIYLTSAECAVLEAMVGGEWMTPVEVAQVPPAAALHVQVIRSALRPLALHRLVERGGWGSSMRWGDWRITKSGHERVNLARQMRLRAVS
ncbi:MAG TPA: hypothetical protein VFI54_06230 [Solirubrobacteraceae bacterium]|nr:hypothetical protein [Solirubrobacteraceae bacterium]